MFLSDWILAICNAPTKAKKDNQDVKDDTQDRKGHGGGTMLECGSAKCRTKSWNPIEHEALAYMRAAEKSMNQNA